MNRHERRRKEREEIKSGSKKKNRSFAIILATILFFGLTTVFALALTLDEEGNFRLPQQLLRLSFLAGVDTLASPENPPCAKYIEPPAEARLETTLSIDLTENGVPADLEWLIVPADQLSVLADGNIKPSENLTVGDTVQMASGRIGTITSTETKLHTPKPVAIDQNDNGLRRVLAKSKRWTETIMNLYTTDEIIGTTPEHPFYVQGNWIEAKDLQAGDKIQTQDGSVVKVLRTEEVNDPQYVYSLLVEDSHNFYVGSGGLLAHNCTDELGRPLFRGGTPNKLANGLHLQARDGISNASGVSDVAWADEANRIVAPGQGISLFNDPITAARGKESYQISSLPDGLEIIQRGQPGHYEIAPSFEMHFDDYRSLLNQVEVTSIFIPRKP